LPTALFVCPDNALLSLLAEGVFNRAPSRGWRSTSAGLTEAPHPDPRLSGLSLPLGLEGRYPRRVAEDLVALARVVVFIHKEGPFGALPDYLSRRIDLRWSVPERDLETVEALRSFLEGRMPEIKRLCEERTPRFL
jgi:hypothetical protein